MIIIAFGRIAQMILMFATIKIVTTLLPPSEMAKVYLVGAAVSFYALLLLNPVGMFMNRRLHAWNAASKVQYFYKLFWFYLVAVCLVAEISFYLFLKLEWISIHSEVGWTLVLIAGSLLFSTLNQVVIPGLNLLDHRGWFVSLTVATSVISLLLAITMVLVFGLKAEYWMIGLFLGQLIIGCVGWKIFYRSLNKFSNMKNITKEHIHVMFGFTWPISLAVGLGWLQSQGYRFLMESNLGLHELGLFAAGYGISAGLISAFESVFTTYLQPNFYKNISIENETGQAKAWGDYAGAIFPSMILIGFFIVGMAPELTRVMLGREYWSASHFIVWGVLAELARVASGVYGMIAHGRMKTKLLIIPSVVGAVLSVGLILWLMPVYKSNGVGIGLMLSSLIACALTYMFTRNEYKSVLPRVLMMRGVFMGIGVILIADFLRWILGTDGEFVSALINLLLVGIVTVGFEYFQLRPLFNNKSDSINEFVGK